MSLKNSYDYIIAGAGASGLSLAWQMINSTLQDKRILVIDDDFSANNDKTWCFWHDDTPPFEKLIHKSYSKAKVIINDREVIDSIDNYPYYCIKSKNYKKHLIADLKNNSSIDFIEAQIEEFTGDEEKAILKTSGDSYSAEYIFQSCFIPPELKNAKIKYPLIQSFLGYEIEVQQSLFDPDTFLMMDFDESYEGGLAFMYLLPWSKNSALIEYTIFDEQIKPEEFYREKIELYLSNKYGLKRIDYKISRVEYGEIPMQDLPYVPWYKPRVMNLGRSGGLTKPSTGYTFKRIQKHSEEIVARLQQSGQPALPYRSKFRYRAYDLWLLHVMYNHPQKALRIFRALFTNNKMDQVFKFLDEKNSFIEDLKIMSTLPYFPFFKAIWHCRKRLFEI